MSFINVRPIPSGLTNYMPHGMTGAPRYNRSFDNSINLSNKRARIDTSGNLSIVSKRMPKSYRRKLRRKRRGIIRKRLPRSLTTRNKIITCKVVDSFSVSHAAGAMQRWTLSVTDITDPFGGGGANQPLGFDQWKTLYDKAKVLGIKVKMTVHNSGSEPIMFGITPRYPNSSTSLADWEYNVEVAGTKSRILSQDIDHGILVLARSAKRMLNIRNLKDHTASECDLNAPTSPTVQAYIECWSQPFDKTTATDADVLIEAYYIVMLYDPIIPARSVA